MMTKPLAATSVLVLTVGLGAAACGGGSEPNASVCRKIQASGNSVAGDLGGVNSNASSSKTLSAMRDLAGRIRNDVGDASSQGLKNAGNKFADDIDAFAQDAKAKNKAAETDISKLSKDAASLQHYCPHLGSSGSSPSPAGSTNSNSGTSSGSG